MLRLTLAAIAIACASPALAQWSSFTFPGSPYTSHNGPDGWTGSSFRFPGSPYTDTTFTGPNGQTRHCSTFQFPGSPYTTTNCN